MNDKTDKTEAEQTSGYVVTSPYITVRVKDDTGSDVIQGFYAGAILPVDVNEDDLDKQVRKGMVAEQGTEEADAATPFGTRVTFDDNGNPLTPQQAAEQEKARAERRAARTEGRTSRPSTADTKVTDPKVTDQKSTAGQKAPTGNA